MLRLYVWTRAPGRRCAGAIAIAIAIATLGLLAAPAVVPARRASENGALFATTLFLNDCLDDCEDAEDQWCLWLKRPGRAFGRVRGRCPPLEPLVSPNGRWVVYERWKPATLVVRRLFGSPPRMGPTRVIARTRPPSDWLGPRFRYGWSPDSRSIAVMTGDDQRGVTLTIARRDGRRRSRGACACPAAESQLAWSRRGRIAYMQAGALSTIDPAGREARQLAGGEPECADESAAPAWSPDARTLLFACRDQLVTFDVTRGSRRTVFDLRRFPDPCLAPSPSRRFTALAWSPDGRSIAYGDPCDIVVMGADGARPRRLRQADQQNGGETLTWAARRR